MAIAHCFDCAEHVGDMVHVSGRGFQRSYVYSRYEKLYASQKGKRCWKDAKKGHGAIIKTNRKMNRASSS